MARSPKIEYPGLGERGWNGARGPKRSEVGARGSGSGWTRHVGRDPERRGSGRENKVNEVSLRGGWVVTEEDQVARNGRVRWWSRVQRIETLEP